MAPRKNIPPINKAKKKIDLLSIYYNTQDFVNRKKALLVGIAVVIIVASSAFAYRQYSIHELDQEASLYLSRILPIYKEKDFEQAIEGDSLSLMGLEEISETYKGTITAQHAKLFLGNCYLMLDRTEDALLVYQDISKQAGQIVYAGSLSGQATCYSNMGNYKEAAEIYLEASEVTEFDVLQATYLEKAAIHYELDGDYKKSLDIFKKIKTVFSESEQAKEAELNINRIKLKL